MASTPTAANSATAKANQTVVDIIAAVRAGDYERAAHLADTVLSLGVEHPIVYNARAMLFQTKGQFREALAEFTRARALAPNDANIVIASGVCLINLNQPADAVRAFDAALAINPGSAQALYRKGWTLEMLGERDEARKAYERAVELDPNHFDALASLAGIIASAGRPKEALPLAERALSLNPEQPTAIVVLGMADLEGENFAEAETRFRKVVDGAQLTLRARAVVYGLLADALDGQDRVDEAFAAYRFEKNEKRKLYGANYENEQRPGDVARQVALFLEDSSEKDWIAESGSEPAPSARHVFLLGFYRSGSTLLEQVLAAHPDVVALEEHDFLAEPAQTYLTSEAGLRRLAAAGNQELAAHREAYWRRVRDHGMEIEGKVFVDKLPMHTLKLPLIAKLFPDAKIVFALRDPRDVILSCYRRHFEINTAMFEFLTLDDAVAFYAAVMRLARAARAKLPLTFHEHRYEDMVEDFETTVRATCAFMGLDWTETMRDFHKAETRLDVRSPSAAQIGRPLYGESVGAWRRYAKHLSFVLPLLRPWVAEFGYPAE